MPKDRNMAGEQKDDFLTEKNATSQQGYMAAFTALIDTCRDEI